MTRTRRKRRARAREKWLKRRRNENHNSRLIQRIRADNLCWLGWWREYMKGGQH